MKDSGIKKKQQTPPPPKNREQWSQGHYISEDVSVLCRFPAQGGETKIFRLEIQIFKNGITVVSQ